MLYSATRVCTALIVMLWMATTALAMPFNGTGDYQTDQYGYYYVITGGKFPTGTTPNGDNGSGGTFRYLTDDDAWGILPIDTWRKDDWFADNASVAMTFRNQGTSVYDNNGIEDNSYGDYYDAKGSHSTHGLHRGYSMSNNFDWIYAGYFEVEETMVITELIGYFDKNGGSADPVPFDPNSPYIRYNMNIFSNVVGDLLPTNTGSFAGDVFNSGLFAGVFSVSDTGVDRIMEDNSTDDIWRLTYTLSQPITLQPGVYWFSHDAVIVPEPATLTLLGLGLAGVGALRRRQRRA